jgi:type I restriction enzyme M protein
MASNNSKDKSLESWIWDAACSIRGAKDAPKYKDYILPLIFTKRLCDVFDDELNRIAKEVGSRKKAFQLAKADHKLVRFYLPLVPEDPEQPVWSVIRKLSDWIGEGVTTHMRAIARANPLLQGIIDRVDFNATTHGQRDLDDDRLSNLIEAISTKRLGLDDVEADIIGKSYEYLIRKFAEGGGQSAGEFYTPPEVGTIMSRVLQPVPGMEIYDPTCGSGGLLVKCEIAMEEASYSPSPPTGERAGVRGQSNQVAPLKLFGQEFTPETWAMANMNMIIHDMEGQIEIGDTFKNPKFRSKGKLRTFDRVVANPMWNQDWFTEADYDNDELDRFPAGAGFPGKSSADWGWVQHIHASMNATGRAAVVLDTGAASRGSGNAGTNKEKTVRQWFVDHDLIESVLYLPENLFYNTTAPGIVLFLNKAKPTGAQGQGLARQCLPGLRKGRPQELHPRSRHPAHRRHPHRLDRSGKTQPHRRPRRTEEERLQHLPQPLHPHQRRRDLPAHRGDRRGTGGHRGRGAGDGQGVAGHPETTGPMREEDDIQPQISVVRDFRITVFCPCKAKGGVA